MNKKVEGGTFS